MQTDKYYGNVCKNFFQNVRCDKYRRFTKNLKKFSQLFLQDYMKVNMNISRQNKFHRLCGATVE